MVALIFGQTLRHPFINYDDNAYVYDNPFVTQGLTRTAVAAAFTQAEGGLWTPLTRLSHVLDWQLFGGWAGGHHLTNLILHAFSTVILFLALRRMTGALWRSAFVAAVFAIHPLHVESVAWVAERKDTLSGLFFALTLLVYADWVGRSRSRVRYLALILLFILGMLAKPMLITLPFVLLLLDYWPLQRISQTSLAPPAWWPCIREKLPLFVVSAGWAWLIIAHPFGRSGVETAGITPPFSLRLSNAVISYVADIWKMFYPTDLAVRYPFPTDGVPLLQLTFSLAVLLLITGGVYLTRRTRPYLFTGWLWYVGMLLPVSQIVLAGSEARCDRYTYLPQIGLYICVAWGVSEFVNAHKTARSAAIVGAALILVVLVALARIQTSYWKSSATLWSHSIACAGADLTARSGYAVALVEAGKLPEAEQQFTEVLRLGPSYSADAHLDLGRVYAAEGKWDEAIAQYQLALKEKPDSASTYRALAAARANQGKDGDAAQFYNRALQLDPNSAEAHSGLAALLASSGDAAGAISHYTTAMRLDRTSAGARNDLAWLLATTPNATVRNGARAVALAEEADRLTGSKSPPILDTLAAAYAEAGQFDKANLTAKRAIEFAVAAKNEALAEQIRQRQQLYEHHQPYHESK